MANLKTRRVRSSTGRDCVGASIIPAKRKPGCVVHGVLFSILDGNQFHNGAMSRDAADEPKILEDYEPAARFAFVNPSWWRVATQEILEI